LFWCQKGGLIKRSEKLQGADRDDRGIHVDPKNWTEGCNEGKENVCEFFERLERYSR
jgi:hypothetical protein